MKGKHIVILLLLLIVIFIVFLIISKKNSNTNSTNSISNSNPSTSGGGIIGSVTGVFSGSFPLHKGSVGNNVKLLQNYLNSKGASLVPDGIFGSLTLAALMKYTGLSSVDQSYFNSNILNGSSSATSSSDVIGKTANAGFYGCRVYRSDFSTYNNLYKTGAAGEWLGVVSGTKTTKDGSLIYLLGSDFYCPAKCAVLS